MCRDEIPDPNSVFPEPLGPGLEAVPLPGVAGGESAEMTGRHAEFHGGRLNFSEEGLEITHSAECANWHKPAQVANDTLREMIARALVPPMAHDFRTALEWHIENYGTQIVDLVNATGVSRDVINKLRARPNSSTTVENALLIASYYGKTVNQFVNCEKVEPADQLQTLIDMLPPEERRIVAAQIRGMLAASQS